MVNIKIICIPFKDFFATLFEKRVPVLRMTVLFMIFW